MAILKIIKAEPKQPTPESKQVEKKTESKKKTKTKTTIDLPPSPEKSQLTAPQNQKQITPKSKQVIKKTENNKKTKTKTTIDLPPSSETNEINPPQNQKIIPHILIKLRTEIIALCEGDVAPNLAYNPNYILRLNLIEPSTKYRIRKIITKLIKGSNAHPENIPRTWEIMCDSNTSVRTKINILSEAVWKDWMSIRIFDDIYLFARILENGCNQVDLDRGSIAVQDLDKIFNLITKQHDL